MRTRTHVLYSLALLVGASFAAGASAAVFVQPACAVKVASSPSFDEVSIDAVGESRELELVVDVLEAASEVCDFDESWIRFRVDTVTPPPEPMTVLDLSAPRVVVVEERDEGPRLSYTTTVTAVGGPALVRLQAVYEPPGAPQDLDHSVMVGVKGEVPKDCPMVVQGFDPTNVLLSAEESALLTWSTKVYGAPERCVFDPRNVLLDVDTPEGEPVVLVAEPGEVSADEPVGDAQTWHFDVDVIAVGEVGFGAVRAAYDPPSPDGTVSGSAITRTSRVPAAVAVLDPAVLVVSGDKLLAAERVPAGQSLWDTPVRITLDLDPAELELLLEGEKDVLVIPAAEDAPGLVAKVLGVERIGEPAVAELEVLAMPAARAFLRYRAKVVGDTYPLPGGPQLPGVPDGLRKADEGTPACTIQTSRGTAKADLFNLKGEGVHVTPFIDVEVEGKVLKSLVVSAAFNVDYHLEGPSVVFDRATTISTTCSKEFDEFSLPFTLVSGPFIFHPKVKPSAGFSLTVTVDSFDLTFKTFTFDFVVDETYGFKWTAGGSVEKIYESRQRTADFDWNPTMTFTNQVGDLDVKVGLFGNFNLGAAADTAVGDLGTLRLLDLKPILETQIVRPSESFFVTPPDEQYQNPSWNTKAILDVTAQPSIEWGDFMKWLGAEDWQYPFNPIKIMSPSWVVGNSPSISLYESASGPYAPGDDVILGVELEGFVTVLDHLLYKDREAKLYARPKGGGGAAWQLVGTEPVRGTSPRLRAWLNARSVVNTAGDWELIATVRGPLLDTLQSPVVTVTVESDFQSKYTPAQIEVEAGPGEVVTREIAFLSFDDETFAATGIASDVAQVVPQATGVQLPPGTTYVVPVVFTCPATGTGEHSGHVTFGWGPMGGDGEPGSVAVSLSCQSFHVIPKELRFTLDAGASQAQPFHIVNHTGSDLTFALDVVRDTANDSTTPSDTILVPGNNSGVVNVNVHCDKPGRREGEITAETAGEPIASVKTVVDCKPAGSGGGSGGGEGGSAGDPHFVTFDGKKYDFQGQGEYVLSRYDGALDSAFEVQTRQVPLKKSLPTNVTGNAAVALKVGATAWDEVSFYAQGLSQDATIWVNGVDSGYLVVDGGPPYVLPNGGTIERDQQSYWIAWPDLGGETSWVVVHDRRTILNVQVFPAPSLGGDLVGLLGDYDGQGELEPFFSDGTPVDLGQNHYCFDPTCFAYGDDSWLVIAANSGSVPLFEYGPGESPEGFVPPPGTTLPAGEPSIGDFPADQVAWATEVCQAGGALAYLEDCRIDVLVSGDPDMGLANGDLWTPSSVWDEVVPSPVGGWFAPALSAWGDTLAATGGDGTNKVLRVYERAGGTWAEVAAFPSSLNHFGDAVAAGDGLIAVGSPYDDLGEDGLVFLYEHTANGWAAVDPQPGNPDGDPTGDHLGASVTVGGSWVAVGAPEDREACGGEPTCDNTGAVQVMDRATGSWVKVLPPNPSTAQHGFYFGSSVALSGGWLYVGAPGAWGDDFVHGAIYVYRFDGSAWVHQATLTEESVPGAGDLGHTVAVEGSLVVAGDEEREMAVVFARAEDNTWSVDAILQDDDENDLFFGRSVALSDGRVLVGIYDNADPTDGLALFEVGDATGLWERAAIVLDPSTAHNHGLAVALSGDAAFTVTTGGSALLLRKR